MHGCSSSNTWLVDEAGNGALGLHILTLEDRTLLLRGTQYLLWPGSICL